MISEPNVPNPSKPNRGNQGSLVQMETKLVSRYNLVRAKKKFAALRIDKEADV